MKEKSPEEGRAVPDYEGWYEISDQGRVRRTHAGSGTRVGRLLQPAVAPNGYQVVCLSRDGNQRVHYVHHLVAVAFLGGTAVPGMNIHHRDADRLNNWAVNLEWITAAENTREARQRTPKAYKYAGRVVWPMVYKANVPLLRNILRRR